jgi:hypothetical protein
MALDTAFRELFSDYVTLKPRVSIDQYGSASFSVGASVAARVQGQYEIIATPDGRDKVQTGVAYLYGTPTVDTSYGMVLSDASEVSILAVDLVTDEEGPHHTVIRFGRGG